MCRSRTRVTCVAAWVCTGVASLAAGPAQAKNIDLRSTTVLMGRQDPLDGLVHTTVPLYELLSLDARDLQIPGADKYIENFNVVLSAWGMANPGSGAPDTTQNDNVHADGDVNLAYVEASVLNQRLKLRLGRQILPGGITRMTTIDGLSIEGRVWNRLGVQAWGGAPVTPRFSTSRGDALGGGRIFWRQSVNTEVGVSFLDVLDKGRLAREDVGIDGRYVPIDPLTLSGYVLWSLAEERLAEGDASASYQVSRNILVTADYQHTAPDLFLPRNSILAVFSEETHDEVGGQVYLSPLRWLNVSGDYHWVHEEAGNGSRGGGKVSVPIGPALVAGEVNALELPDNGYLQTRLYGAYRLSERFGCTLDGDVFLLNQAINGHKTSFTATATVSYGFLRHWLVVLTGVGGFTPFVKKYFEGMLKVAYNPPIASAQVRP